MKHGRAPPFDEKAGASADVADYLGSSLRHNEQRSTTSLAVGAW